LIPICRAIRSPDSGVHAERTEVPRRVAEDPGFPGALRERNSFERDDGTPLNYTLVNIKDWCKNSFEVVNQLRINTDNSHHRYDVMLLINGMPVVQIELKTLAVSPRRAMQQIVDYKNDPGNGYSKTLLCFLQLFIVSNRSDTWYFANNNAATSASTPTSASCRSTSSPTKTTEDHPSRQLRRRSSSPNARWAR
jgi:type I site-specific restriction-modification system R (restriction) subunit